MINKTYVQYVGPQELVLAVTALDIEGPLDFQLNGADLVIKNKKNTYLLSALPNKALTLIQEGKALLVEVGKGVIIDEYAITPAVLDR